jgi:hypothetical protein
MKNFEDDPSLVYQKIFETLILYDETFLKSENQELNTKIKNYIVSNKSVLKNYNDKVEQKNSLKTSNLNFMINKKIKPNNEIVILNESSLFENKPKNVISSNNKRKQKLKERKKEACNFWFEKYLTNSNLNQKLQIFYSNWFDNNYYSNKNQIFLSTDTMKKILSIFNKNLKNSLKYHIKNVSFN